MYSKATSWPVFSLLTLITVLAVACGPTATPPPGVTPTAPPEVEVVNPDTLVWSTFGDLETLDTAWTYETFGASVEVQIYEGMIFYNKGNSSEFVPQLATDWTIEKTDEGTVRTFNIREGVTFHQGGTLEPHDIAYSLQRGLIQDRADGPQWLLYEPIFGVDLFSELVESEGSAVAACQLIQSQITADDAAGTVTIVATGPAIPIPFLQVLSQPWGAALDMEWMVEQGDWPGTCETAEQYHDPAAEGTVLFNAANGTGPYMLDHWTPGEEVVLVRNPNYWRTEPIWEGGPSGLASIERIVVSEVDEWGTRFAMTQVGDADLVTVPREFRDQAMEIARTACVGVDEDGDPINCQEVNPNGRLMTVLMPGVREDAIIFNFNASTEGGNSWLGSGEFDGLGVPPDFFSDVHVRRAFNYCFDFETFHKEVFLGEATIPRGPIINAPGMLGYSDDSFAYSYDPAKCEEEFKQAYDGQLWETGFYIVAVYNTGNTTRKAAMEILERGVEAVNDEFNIVVFDMSWPVFLGERRAERLPLLMVGWLEDYHHPSNWASPFTLATGAFARAQNFPEDLYAQFQDLYDRAIAAEIAGDLEEADALWRQVNELSTDQAVDIFVFQSQSRYWGQEYIKGWYFNPLYPNVDFGYVYAYSKG